MKINRTFLGQRLKEARKKKGLTQQQLGELTELSDKYISRIETGKADMSLDCFVALINTLEILLIMFFRTVCIWIMKLGMTRRKNISHIRDLGLRKQNSCYICLINLQQ